ncbi:hypothetical protein BSKO_04493 [Bryopsis sp. KO-2023]|nr:hypothetical protein BSKO_04493 [Bryopsis sp. KO-2023]
MGRGSICLVAILVLVWPCTGVPTPLELKTPKVVLSGRGFTLGFSLQWPAAQKITDEVFYRVMFDGRDIASCEQPPCSFPSAVDDAIVVTGEAPGLIINDHGKHTVTLQLADAEDFTGSTSSTKGVWVAPGGLTLFPPLLTILLAVVTRHVLLSLFLGTFVAVFIVEEYNLLWAFLRTLDKYILGAVADADHVFVILFSWFLAGMVAVIQKNGGARGVAEALGRYANTPKTGQLVTYLLGWVIFFDDYANTLIIGQTMRPITDALWISREKLAFLVDATSAPVASLAPIGSWIGFEIGLIGDQVTLLKEAKADLSGYETSSYIIFLRTIPSRYYPILMLIFQLTLILTNREMGPMLAAERRARYSQQLSDESANRTEVELDNKLLPNEDTPRKWWNSIIPIAVTVIFVILGLLLSGNYAIDDGDKSIENIFSNADSFGALLWAAFLGSFTVWLINSMQSVRGGVIVGIQPPLLANTPCLTHNDGRRPLMSWRESFDAWVEGIKNLTGAILILIMAWTIGSAFTDAGVGEYVADAISENVDHRAIPALTFVIAAVISFATGTSWGTMSILFPIAVPTAYYASPGDTDLFYTTISSILAGSVFGDHSTAISDTTVLSSLATKCDIRHHVATQLPYALWVATIGVLLGDIGSGYAWPDWVGLILGAIFVVASVFVLAVRVDKLEQQDPITTVVSKLRRKLGWGQPSFSLTSTELIKVDLPNSINESKHSIN